MTAAAHVTAEIASQPACWARAAQLAATVGHGLPQPGERVAVVGCGTSFFMARAYAVLRERAGQGETDAHAASEAALARPYDRIVAITRSGTTTEVLSLLDEVHGRIPTVALTGVPDGPVADCADALVDLSFADERSVVQTRFANTSLQLLRSALGFDLSASIADGELAVEEPLPRPWSHRTQFTFLGRGWTVGLADEAALKLREAARAWTESYAAMEYRHGPISISDENSLVWSFGEPPAGLEDEVSVTGALFSADALDPVASLVRAQRLAVELAARRNMNPDRPRNLSRSVILAGLTGPSRAVA
ncbi:SIS domain-containing protein [Streptomyces sp. NBC_00237]|uniref:SIS domain-containing protein n=1 Tax=Streptomyces sp. NBC_00237 TaxID=2975687 RepID=UPI0022539C1A|nr:SIS domain-containing protein [Streptomyces sp. NBC_00237]MCX5207010.1 SIS domain-containing protein [Streptomyces sp. NBC_00237]